MRISEDFCDLCGKRFNDNVTRGIIHIVPVGVVGTGMSYTICHECSRKYEQMLNSENTEAKQSVEELIGKINNEVAALGLE